MLEVSADAFLLPVGSGFRFCLLRLPRSGSLRGSLLVAPPFAEELNKSRRMIALAAERIAASGYAVLEIDCLGCGDSSGVFGDATWDEWISDLERGYQWLENRYEKPKWIWGIRAGALLATATLRRIERSPNLLFWQPVISGRQHLTQFLRLKFANEFIGERGTRSGTQELIERFSKGETLEIAGYCVTPDLAKALADAELAIPSGFAGKAICLEVKAADNGDISPALKSCVERWRRSGATVLTRSVNGVPFWQTQQITEAPELIESTCSNLLEADQ